MIKLSEALDEEIAWQEHLASIETDLLAIEKGGEEFDEEAVNRVFWTLHSVKKTAGSMNLKEFHELANSAEEVLALLRSRKLSPGPAGIGVLLRAVDRLQVMIRNPGVSDAGPVAVLTEELASLCGREPEKSLVSPEIVPLADGAKQLRVLLVEDDFASRLLLQTFLSRYGECHIAVNGREAVNAFRAALTSGNRYDLICMDIMMPEMDGREAVRQVRKLEEGNGIYSDRGAKIIMTTTVDDIKEVMQCFRELCDAYLTKPIDLTKLLNQMKSYNLVD